MSDEQPSDGDAADQGAFAYFSLEGARFDAEGMPADSAREVAAYREALLEIARSLWLAQNPDRRRVPNGFPAAFDLRLTGVGEGSARPRLKLNRPARGVSDEDWAEWAPIYAQARDVATRDVREIDSAGRMPESVSKTVRQALRRVGTTLDADERLTMGAPGPQAPRATLTSNVRAILREIEAVLPPEPRAMSAEGVVTEYDGESLSFVLRTASRRVTCVLEVFNEPLAMRAREVLAIDGVTAPDVRVEGETLDADDAVRRIFNVHTLEIVWTIAEKVIVGRLRALVGLGPDWLGPGSSAPPAELVEMLEPVVPDLATLGFPVAVVANADGSVVLDWRAGDVEYTVELDPDRSLFMCADNVVTDELAERQVPFDLELLRRFITTGTME